MAQSLSNIMSSVDEKLIKLIEHHKQQTLRIDELQAENNNLHAELEETKRELEKSRQDTEFLVMSHRLADNPDTIIQTRRRIARLIRTIDKCISIIRDE